MDDSSYREQRNIILHEQEKAENAELERLTLDALKQGELKGCI